METKRNITPEGLEESVKETKQEVRVSTYDAKNYLNVRLDTKKGELKKELRIRLLPIDKDSATPFKKVLMHNAKVRKEISESGYKSYVCLEKVDDIDHERLGNSCPFCEKAKEAWKNYKEATDDAEKQLWKETAMQNMPSEFCIVRCIERGHEEDGPKFWKFAVRSDKKDPMNSIINLYKTRNQESIDDGDGPVNILDVYEGKDLKITIDAVLDKQGRVTNKTSVTVTDYGKIKPLSEDEEQINAWIDDEKKWSDVFVSKPYEYLEIVMRNKIPFFDKEKMKWVEMIERKNHSEEGDEEYTEENGTDVEEQQEQTPKVTTVQEKQADSDLPF